jgi:hypothetical protein
MKVRQPDRFLRERVEVGRLEHRIAGGGKVAHPLIVGHDDQDIRRRFIFGGPGNR